MPSSSSFRSDLLNFVRKGRRVEKGANLPRKWAANALDGGYFLVFSSSGFTVIKKTIVSEIENIETKKKEGKKTYRPFLPRLAGFTAFGSRTLSSHTSRPSSSSTLFSSSSSTLRLSSEPPLLCLVFRFFGASLGSDSPRFRVIRALAGF